MSSETEAVQVEMTRKNFSFVFSVPFPFRTGIRSNAGRFKAKSECADAKEK